MAEMSLIDATARRTAVVRGRVSPADLPDFVGRVVQPIEEAPRS